jgi:glycerol-3-phosphate acyltransferase PlsY
VLTAVIIVAAYLLGAVPFGVIVSRWYGIKDIRAYGSGNIGATNVWRVAGFKAAVWVYLGDIGKGAAAVMLGRGLAERPDVSLLPRDVFLVVCALAAVLGHIFPIYLKFRGGKGVNTALGAMLVLLPLETAVGFIIFVLVAVTSRFISLGSLAGAVGFCVFVVLERLLMLRHIAAIYVYLAIGVAVLILITHRANIRRLLSGTEPKFSFSSKTKSEAPRV